MLYAILQQVVVALIVVCAAGYAFCSLAPRRAAHLRGRIGQRVLRAGGSPRLRTIAKRWTAEATAQSPHCELCASCSGCAREKTRHAPVVTRHAPKH